MWYERKMQTGCGDIINYTTTAEEKEYSELVMDQIEEILTTLAALWAPKNKSEENSQNSPEALDDVF